MKFSKFRILHLTLAPTNLLPGFFLGHRGPTTTTDTYPSTSWRADIENDCQDPEQEAETWRKCPKMLFIEFLLRAPTDYNLTWTVGTRTVSTSHFCNSNTSQWWDRSPARDKRTTESRANPWGRPCIKSRIFEIFVKSWKLVRALGWGPGPPRRRNEIHSSDFCLTCMRAVNRSTMVPARRPCRDGLANRNHTITTSETCRTKQIKQKCNNNNNRLKTDFLDPPAITRTQFPQIQTNRNTKIEQQHKTQHKNNRSRKKTALHAQQPSQKNI